jgi:glycerol kinase
MTPRKVIAAIDQGTSSTRCLLFDQDARIVSGHQLEHRQIFPRPGWVEHDPLEIWNNTQQVIKAALAKRKIHPTQIASIGIADQRETSIVWNKTTGQPYYNAIVWQCTRSQEICDILARDGGKDRFRETTGLPLEAYFSGPKIKWILDNIPGVRQDAEKGKAIFGNVDSWLIWWLSGGPSGGSHVTDVTNASRTLLMNLRTLEWDEEILKILNIPRQMMPEIRPSSDSRKYASSEDGGPFGRSIPICGDLGDQQSALVGQNCFDPGDTKNTYGTGCFMLMNTGLKPVPSRHGLLTTVGYQVDRAKPIYCLEGSVAVAGALVQWLRDNLGFFKKSATVEDLAKTVENNGGIYFVPAFSGLFAPHWRSDARGVVVGLTRYINKGHFARAALESTAFQTRDVLEAMENESGIKLAELKVDGGMVRNELLMQFQADILNCRVVRSKVAETTALGAAFMAGLAIGFWKDLAELRRYWTADKTWEPQLDRQSRERQIHNWKKALQRSLNWVE